MTTHTLSHTHTLTLSHPHTHTHTHTADPPTIAGPEYEFMLYDNESSMCFYASFKLNFKIAYYGYNVSNHSRIDAMVSAVNKWVWFH